MRIMVEFLFQPAMPSATKPASYRVHRNGDARGAVHSACNFIASFSTLIFAPRVSINCMVGSYSHLKRTQT